MIKFWYKKNTQNTSMANLDKYVHKIMYNFIDTHTYA